MDKKEKTDWDAFDKISDESIAKAIALDPDAAPWKPKACVWCAMAAPSKPSQKNASPSACHRMLWMLSGQQAAAGRAG